MVKRAAIAVTMVSNPKAAEPPLKSYNLWLDSASEGRHMCTTVGLRFMKVSTASDISDLSTPWRKRDGTWIVIIEAKAAAAMHISNAIQGETPPA